MADEATYTIPLRKEWQKTPPYKRAKKAVAAVRKFVQKHMKYESVLIGPKLNLKLWEHGIKNPPHHVKVTCYPDEKESVCRVELFGFKFEKKEKKEKEKKAKGIAGKLQEKLGPKEEKEAPKEMKSGKAEMKKAERKMAEEEKKETPKPAETKTEEKPAEEKLAPEEKKE
ncbi:60S ribosomal protein L31 [Candidatus Woesearchaeota archaeon]|nr:60S ribosomal protein L31 [Candidatus Woesearchaeota archaeon]